MAKMNTSGEVAPMAGVKRLQCPKCAAEDRFKCTRFHMVLNRRQAIYPVPVEGLS